MTVVKKLRFWLMEIRAPFFTASVLPILLGAAIAWSRLGQFHWSYFLLTLVAGVLLHAGANVANDYFDHKSGTDEINVDYVRPFTGGSRMIQRGLLSPREVLAGSIIFFFLGSVIGIYLAYQRGFFIFLLGAIGICSGLFYTAPPLLLVSRGIGEVVVGLNFGILMTVGAYYVQTMTLSWEPLVASIPLAMLITNVLHINQFQDAAADEAVGKKHLVVRFGKQRAERLYEFILWGTYIYIVISVFTRIMPIFALLALLSFPLSYKAIKTARQFFDDNLKLAPANATTIMIHLLCGIFLTAAYILDKVI